jgi:hypothetical protein
MKNLIFTTILLYALLMATNVTAQCDTTAYYANQLLPKNFISDGQSYRALLYDDQIAEFQTTFYGGAKYRIVSYSGVEKEQLIFSLYDQDNNLLFTNEDHKNSAYWDFEFKSTIAGRIEAKLDDLKQSSGCAVLLIGFER